MNELDLSSLNLIDALLALIVLVSLVAGWGRGFLTATLQLFTLAASLVAAFAGYHYPQAWLEVLAPALGVWTAPLSFLATYILAHLAFGRLAGALAGVFPRTAHAHGINRALGLAPGGVNGLINAMLASLLLLTLPLSDGLSKMTRESVLAGQLSVPAQWLEARLAPIFHPALQRTLQALTVPTEPNATIKLPYQVASPKVRPDLEARKIGRAHV